MNITITNNDNVCTMAIEGRIDTLTSAELEEKVKENAPLCDKMVFDMAGVDYISSAGLRAVVFTHREMEKKGGLTLKNICKNVQTILNMTGFSKKLNIEE